MYTKNDAQQFEAIVNALASTSAISKVISEAAIEAVYARINNERIGDELLSRAEAAEYLKCSLKTVDRLLDEGKLTRIRTSKRAIRIRLSEVKEMLNI